MIIFLENYHADKFFVALMGLAALVFVCLTLKNISITNKIINERSITFQGVAYLAEKACAFVKKVFLHHIVNNGTIITTDIVIDDNYLTDKSRAYLKKR